MSKSGPRGLPIATPSTCLNSLLLNIKTLSSTARHNNLVNCCLLKPLKTSMSLKILLACNYRNSFSNRYIWKKRFFIHISHYTILKTS